VAVQVPALLEAGVTPPGPGAPEIAPLIGRRVGVGGAAVAEWDAIVIGAGPAGSVAAHGIAAAGARVLVVDRSDFPRWKVCGCCISAWAAAMLRGAGLSAALRCGVPLEGLRVAARGAEARIRIRGGCVLSRARLDAALLGAAASQGASFLHASALVRGGSVLVRAGAESAEVRASAVIAADGLQGSSLREAPEFAARVSGRSRIGLGAVLAGDALPLGELPPGIISMSCAPAGYAGMVRMEDGSIDVAAAVDPGFVRMWPTPAEAVKAILEGAGTRAPRLEDGRFRGTPALTRRRPVEHGRVLVAGDAAAYVEPFTGEGMAWAIASGLAVAEHVKERLAGRYREGQWSREHARLIARRQLACRVVAAALRRPEITRAAVGAASLAPGIVSMLARRIHGSHARGAVQ
jgi:menaquinone-9 beta-reductase